MKKRQPIILILIAAIVASMAFVVSCGGKDDAPKSYTISFETFGGTEVTSIGAIGGSMIFAPKPPQKSGHTFIGWYTSDKFEGEPVEIPNVMPKRNVKYYAKFVPVDTEYTLTYEYNLGKVPHGADISAVTEKAGAKLTVADGSDFAAEGYMFVGWSVTQSGEVSLTEKKKGQYNAGDEITLAADTRLYAQWARGYTARDDGDGIIYVYYPNVKQGKGAAILVRDGKDDMLGFVTFDENAGYTGYIFDFYAEEFEGGQYSGRLFPDGTYGVADGRQGQYVLYNYPYDTADGRHILALDGFGFAVWTELKGDMLTVAGSGSYEYDKDFNSFLFKYTNDKDKDDADPSVAYFVLEEAEVENTEIDGYFRFMGLERGSFANYDNGSLSANYRFDLDGYGTARVNVMAADGTTVTDKYEGKYFGTDEYESFYGEWRFVPNDKTVEGFEFILTTVSVGNDSFPVYIMFDDEYYGSFTEQDGDATLYLDGYGSALYTVGTAEYFGECTVNNDLVTFVPFAEDDDGSVVSVGTTYFNINRTTNKFTLNQDGYIVSEGTLTDYRYTSPFAVIPDSATKIAADAFNYTKREDSVSLISVVIHDGVTEIGARAFQNNHTLRRVQFLSETPIAIDFSDANSPFRWPAGDFIIVVPEGKQDAYKSAWSDCPYKIMGSVEVTVLPEFDVEDGVLVRYNKPTDAGDAVNVVIPDEVTKIAAGVFRGLDFVVSVDLNNVVEVGAGAFEDCVNLTTVKAPMLERIGDGAFVACVKLSSGEAANVIELPKIKILGSAAFSGCQSLVLVRLGADIAEIGDFAFLECNVYEKAPPLFVELTGDALPKMGDKVTNGNIAFRFKVQSIDVALKCYKAADWNLYCKHLYIESGDERGLYMSGSTSLELNGRAVYLSSYMFLYAIDGEKITLYEYDAETQTYETVVGTYKNEVIDIRINNVLYRFKRAKNNMTYVTADGKYTLECNPNDMLPENYENYYGEADVKFNGKDVKMTIIGYNTKIIYGFTDTDGIRYDFSISFDNDELIVTKTRSAERLENITASDGSKITLLFSGDLIYVETAEFNIEVANGIKLKWTSVSGVTALRDGNVYTFYFRHATGRYNFTATVSADGKTFTYTVDKVTQ